MTASVETKMKLHKLLWSLPEEDVAELAESVARDFLDELDPTSRERIDAVIERKLKSVLGPAAGRWAKSMLEDIRGRHP